MGWLPDSGMVWLTEHGRDRQQHSRPESQRHPMDLRRRRILLTMLVVVVAVVVASVAAGALASFPTSLLLPLLMMAVATALFYIWA
jgi:hypothetical protein